MKRVSYFLMVILGVSCSEDSIKIEGNDPIPNTLKNVVWTKNFGGSGYDSARSIIQTTDGGFAILGMSNSTDGDLSSKNLAVNDYWLVKLDMDGDLEWQKTYGGSKDDQGQQVIQTSDGGYAITGYAMSDDGDGSNNEGFHDNWILRLDAAGNILWEKSFGFSGHDHSYDLVETVDGGFFFSGFLDVTSSNGEGSTDKGRLTAHGVGEFWGTKIDGDGNLQWRKFFGGTNNDRSFGVVNAHDGGYILVGASESDDFDIGNPKGSYDFWAVKINKNGTFVWESSFGGTGIDQAQDIVATTDGGYVITGNTFSEDTQVTKNNGQSDVWLIKIDDNGQLLWEKSFGGAGFDAAHSVRLTMDEGFLVCGNSKSFDGDLAENFGENDIWVFKTDASGNLEWEKSLGGSNLDFGYDALETATGNVVVIGETTSQDFPEIQTKGGMDMVVINLQ
ncbi:hypothetical protein L0P88_09270 [Muricauda sp. SCSIO 64092]|uniref:hypothetical protein n=1 Tax=Allomuricauda sp. SCSIO 64092 TaxID=2908842 RepID=UPI001FF1C2C3|nr:hypothetical protein [Muricauda sp. SCSIO 64092]UOY08725.1 hypothetical protein L0P88_09270 [Muricauda sp. SCSIO 64092]